MMIGIDNLDNRILKLLGKAPLHASAIAQKLNIGRTTVQYRLTRLHREKLARKTISGRKSIWHPIYRHGHNKKLFQPYSGEEFFEAYHQLFTLPRKSLILAVQGSGAANSEFDNLPPLLIKKAHRVFKNRGIILKGISNKQSLQTFERLSQDMIESHIGRTQGLKMLDSDDFLSSGEIMSTPNFLLLSNPKAKFALVIKNNDLTKIMNDVLKLLFELLDEEKTFDLNRYLKTKSK